MARGLRPPKLPDAARTARPAFLLTVALLRRGSKKHGAINAVLGRALVRAVGRPAKTARLGASVSRTLRRRAIEDPSNANQWRRSRRNPCWKDRQLSNVGSSSESHEFPDDLDSGNEGEGNTLSSLHKHRIHP
jgi:hypothetical protein